MAHDDEDWPSEKDAVAFFGAGWPADKQPMVAVPVGQACLMCTEPVHAGSVGVVMTHLDADGASRRPVHHRCLMRSLGIGEDSSRRHPPVE